MSQNKKQVRAGFRAAVFTRDRFRCRGCGYQSSPATAVEELDAHHITDRNEMPNGGYVPENGISLCKTGNDCHRQAEEFHATGTAAPGFGPADLYNIIGSSHERAVRASERAGA